MKNHKNEVPMSILPSGSKIILYSGGSSCVVSEQVNNLINVSTENSQNHIKYLRQNVDAATSSEPKYQFSANLLTIERGNILPSIFLQAVREQKCMVSAENLNRVYEIKYEMDSLPVVEKSEDQLKVSVPLTKTENILLAQTKVKPHKCVICEKYFTNVSQLNAHLKNHSTGNKPYSKYIK